MQVRKLCDRDGGVGGRDVDPVADRLCLGETQQLHPCAVRVLQESPDHRRVGGEVRRLLALGQANLQRAHCFVSCD